MQESKVRKLLNLLPQEYSEIVLDIYIAEKPHHSLVREPLTSFAYVMIIIASIITFFDFSGGLLVFFGIWTWYFVPEGTLFGLMNKKEDNGYNIAVFTKNCKTELQMAYTLFHEVRHCWQYEKYGTVEFNYMRDTYVGKNNNDYGHNDKLTERDANLFATLMLKDNADAISNILEIKKVNAEYFANKFDVNTESILLSGEN